MPIAAGSLADRIKLLLNNSVDDADVYFLVGKGDQKELLSAHKLILKTASEVFDTMFRFDSKNAKAKNVAGSIVAPVEVIDVEADAFKAMLKFIYSDDLSGLSGHNLFDVLYAAKKYNVFALIKACAEFPLSKLSNVFETMLKARFIEEKQFWDFARHCLDYIDQNAEVLFKLNAFLQIDQKLLCELLGRDQLKMNNEFSLWNAALHWADEQCRRNGIDCSAENRRQMLGSALFQLCFPIIPKENFLQSIVPCGVLTSEEILSVLLHHCQSVDHQDRLLAKLYPPRFGSKQRAQLTEWEKQKQKSFVSATFSSICHRCKKIKNAVPAPCFRAVILCCSQFFFTLILLAPSLFGPLFLGTCSLFQLHSVFAQPVSLKCFSHLSE